MADYQQNTVYLIQHGVLMRKNCLSDPTWRINFKNTVVVHKVIIRISHPYALTKCRLPLLHTRLDQMLKHMTRRVLWRPQKQTIDSILDLKQLTSCNT